MDVSDQSDAIRDLNLPTELAKLPAKVMYGEIINSKVRLGILSLGALSYSAFDGAGTIPNNQLSAAAEAHILGPSKTPEDFRGDGLVPGSHQQYTQLDGFPPPGYPPAPPPAVGQNTIPRLLVDDQDLVHTDAPLQHQDIYDQLKVLAPGWFP
jgi:hypothetical protein